MTVKYLGRKYTVSFKDKCCIQRIKAKQWFIRQKRRSKILFKPVDFALYGGITVCWLVFALCTHWVGMNSGLYGDATRTVLNAIWDIRNQWFSSVILAMAINAFNRGREHKKKIAALHNIYCNAMFDFEELLASMCEKTPFNPIHPLYSKQLLNVVDELRIPWRKDIKSKFEVLTILDQYPQNRMSERHYYNMLLNGIHYDYDDEAVG